jgi:hypothetical protein
MLQAELNALARFTAIAVPTLSLTSLLLIYIAVASVFLEPRNSVGMVSTSVASLFASFYGDILVFELGRRAVADLALC